MYTKNAYITFRFVLLPLASSHGLLLLLLVLLLLPSTIVAVSLLMMGFIKTSFSANFLLAAEVCFVAWAG